MSTDFIALFDISSKDVTAEWLLAKFAANLEFAAEIVERYRDFWEPKSWTIKASPETGGQVLLGPGGFAIRIRPRMIELYHMMRFATFTGDVATRKALRRACLVIADLAGSANAIYTHELMPCEFFHKQLWRCQA